MEQDNVLLAKERLKNQHDKMKIGMQILLQQIIETHIIKKKQKKSEKSQCSARQDTIDSTAGKPVVKHK
jgi:hypothetical protein